MSRPEVTLLTAVQEQPAKPGVVPEVARPLRLLLAEDNLTNRGKAFVDGFIAAMLNLLQ